MRDRRDKMSIIQDILKAAEDPMGAKKTHLVYGANLNFNRLEKYLIFLFEKELIEVREEPEKKYYITSRGRDFMKQAKKLEEFI